jgi:hypothetical protein
MAISFAEVTRDDSQAFCELRQTTAAHRAAKAASIGIERALSWERRQSVSARLFALSTDLGADAAVLVMVRVPLTLIAASLTSFDATLKSYSGELGDELGLPAEDAAGRDADVTAVGTQRDAGNEGFDVGLAEVGVSAGCAGLSTVEARVDAGNQRPDFHRECARMCLQNLLSVGHDPSSLSRSDSSRQSNM